MSYVTYKVSSGQILTLDKYRQIFKKDFVCMHFQNTDITVSPTVIVMPVTHCDNVPSVSRICMISPHSGGP